MPTIGWPRHGSNGSDGADHNQDARLEPLVDAAHLYLLDRSDARDIIETQVATIRAAWSDACDAAMFTAHERDRFWERQFLNPHAFQACSLLTCVAVAATDSTDKPSTGSTPGRTS